MDLRLVFEVSETRWWWPEYCIFLGSTQQGMCKLDRNSAQPVFLSLDSKIWLAVTKAPFLFSPSYHSIAMSCFFVSFFKWLFFFQSLSLSSPSHPTPPGDLPSLGSTASFSPLLVKYNIYPSLFEFTHPYHWVCSQWLWGGLVQDSLTLYWPWNMYITIKGGDKRGGISTRACNLELTGSLKLSGCESHRAKPNH